MPKAGLRDSRNLCRASGLSRRSGGETCRQHSVMIFPIRLMTENEMISSGSEPGAFFICKSPEYQASVAGLIPAQSSQRTARGGGAPFESARLLTPCSTRCSPRMAWFELSPWSPLVTGVNRVMFTPAQKISASFFNSRSGSIAMYRKSLMRA